jgi:retron-type reverse transcriptase
MPELYPHFFTPKVFRDTPYTTAHFGFRPLFCAGKVHSLTGRITEKLMRQAFKSVKRNRGAAGIDKVSIKMFEANLDENLAALMRALKKRGIFQPLPLRRHYIPKGENEFRPLGIPAVRDRVAQEVMRRLLNPIFDRMFHENSFGFKEGRNCHMAIETVNELHAQGYRWVLDADIKGFFNNIPHKVIMQIVASEVAGAERTARTLLSIESISVDVDNRAEPLVDCSDVIPQYRKKGIFSRHTWGHR